jgi:ubiquinol-cytochrome c reductase cytochrome b subunit
MIRGLVGWLDERLGTANFTRRTLNKVFPDHWSFMLGEAILYSFIILVATGVYLSFFYEPSSQMTVYTGSYAPLAGVEVSRAYASALELSFDVRAGLFVRQVHHWAALVFVGMLVLHAARVFFTGAFRKPRELNWVIGVGLLLLALVSGFTGYSLLDDQLSGTGLRIAYSVLLSIPVVGTWLTSLLLGGEFPGTDILSRLFVVHILIVPAIIAGLVLLHFLIMIRQKHTQFPGPGRSESNVVGLRLWPTYAAKATGLFFLTGAVLSALGGLVQINPIWLFGPYRVSEVSSAAQPDWYMGWLEGAQRLMPPWEVHLFGYEIPNPFFPGVVLPAVTFLLLFLWPWIEARFTGDREVHHLLDRPRDRPVRTAFGAAALAFYGVLFIAGSSDVISVWSHLSVNLLLRILQALVVLAPLLAWYYTKKACVRRQQAPPRPAAMEVGQ